MSGLLRMQREPTPGPLREPPGRDVRSGETEGGRRAPEPLRKGETEGGGKRPATPPPPEKKE